MANIPFFDKRDVPWWLLAALAVVLGASLFNHAPIPSSEPRFAAMVKNMAESGNYVIPTKRGSDPYAVYPPLYAWLAVTGERLGLPIVAAIRLPAYVALLLWVLWLGRLQRFLTPPSSAPPPGRLSWPRGLLPIVCATLPGIFYEFFLAQVDGLLALGVLIAFVGFYRVRFTDTVRGFPWEMWIGITLAVLTKGPIGLMLTVPAMAAEVTLAHLLEPASQPVSQRIRRWWVDALRLYPFRGLLLVVVASVPGYLAVGLAHSWELVRALLVYQNFTRFTTGFHHHQPWWYYLETVATDLLPISLLLPFGLWAAARHLREPRLRFSLCWATLGLVILSASAAKQSKYIVPLAPAFVLLALLGVELLATEHRRDRVYLLLRRWSIAILAVLGVAIVAVLPFFSDQASRQDQYREVRRILEQEPARLVTFPFPRSMMLYELGSDLEFIGSSRELYRQIASGELAPGTYVLTEDRTLREPEPGKPSDALWPPPEPPWLETVYEGHRLLLFRVMAGARGLTPPVTPEPVPVEWWSRFDTD